MAVFLNVAALFLVVSLCKSQEPVSYTVNVKPHEVNGSSPTGHCSNTKNMANEFECKLPRSSVLFDRSISTLSNPTDSSMWASQLLTLNAIQSSVRISTTISTIGGSHPIRLSRVEIAMFNCPQWRIEVSKIVLFYPSQGTPINGFSAERNVTVASCDSLVSVCLTCTGSCDIRSSTALDLTFHLTTGADWVHIAEIEFFFNATETICLADIMITTSILPVTNATMPTSPATTITTPMPPVTTFTTSTPPVATFTTPTTPAATFTTPTPPVATFTTPTPPVATFTTPTPPVATFTTPTPPVTTITTRATLDMNATSNIDPNVMENSSLSTILPAVFLSLLFILVCVLVALLLLWRCYFTKHHKHNTTPHTALGEEAQCSPHPHSHPPPLSLCDETGQVLYSTVTGEDNHYISHLQHSTSEEKDNNRFTAAKDDSVDYLYAQVDKKGNTKKDAITTNPNAVETGTDVSQLYAQVDKKKSKKKADATGGYYVSKVDLAVDQLDIQLMGKKEKKKDAMATTMKVDTDVSQLYAQVDKKTKKKETTSHNAIEAGIVDQLYAQIDKKQCKKKAKELSEDATLESEAMYSVVNKPRAPQLPPKSDLLMDELEP